MRGSVPLTQNDLRPGFVELAFGEPAPSLLPEELVRAAAADVLRELGRGAIAYGKPPGPIPLREAVTRRIAEREGLGVPWQDVYITGGNSPALDLILTVFTQPGDVALVESPTYNLALGTLRDHPVEIVGVGHDASGLDVDDLEAALDRVQAAGRRARLLYTVPTFHNPAGACLAESRRARLLDLSAERDLLLVEDDVYRELCYDGVAPRALWTPDGAAPVFRLGSFSKSLTPGLRVGWVNARRDLLDRLEAAGVLDSGGAPSHFAACVAAVVVSRDGYDAHIERLRAAYASRRDALAAALREHLPAGCSFDPPAGGFFIWLRLPPGVQGTDLLPLAESHGVGFAPGRRFCVDGDDNHVRLGFSLFDEEQLAEGARRLGAALREHLGQT